MLRFRIFVSTLPLLLAGLFAHGEPSATSRPCISIDDASIQIAPTPWQAQRHVSFTDNPANATVRVRIVDNAESADFAVVDDVGDPDAASSCAVTRATEFIGISATSGGFEPMIFLSREGPADYRIFVQSRTFSIQDAAALVVSANYRRPRIADASL